MVDNSARSQYLQAMGIKQWAPRKPLSGAKPSSSNSIASAVTSLEVGLPGQNSEVVEEPVIGLSNPVAASLSSLSNLPAEAVNSNTQESKLPGIDTDIVDAGSSVPPQFRLESFLFAEKCLVINDVTSDIDTEQREKSLRLLGNILTALNIASSKATNERTFNWPLLRNTHIDQSKAVAIDALQAFINKQLAGQTVKFILLMGLNAQEFALPSSEVASKPPELNGYQVVATKSLRDILLEPALKRQAWSDLQCLRPS